MPIDRTMTVSLSDPGNRSIVSFRRTGSQVFVETAGEGGETRSTPVSAADLAQLAAFLGDLANTRWSESTVAEAPVPAPASPAAPAAAPTAASSPMPGQQPRPGGLPPYPQTARWVPAPSGGIPGPDSNSQS